MPKTKNEPIENELSEFSIRMRTARINSGFTQRELAEKTRVGYRSIQRYETFDKSQITSEDDLRISPANLSRLSQALDVTIEYLLFGDDQMDIYMNDIKKELMNLSKGEICDYHKKPLTDKVLSHLRLTDSFIDDIHKHWKDTINFNCYRAYVQDTIIRYCHHRKGKGNKGLH